MQMKSTADNSTNDTIMEQSLRPIIESLEDLFSKFNSRFYDGKLQTPVIAINSKGRKPVYGWCTLWRAWGNDEDESNGYFEINISAEYLNREPEEIAGTLLHEMVHLYCVQNGIQDCSRSGTYHNKQFRNAAEAHGLIATKVEKYGWTHTELNEEATEYLAMLNWKGFSLFRRSDEASTSKKSSARKYVCPLCGQKVRATKAVNIICADCDMPMEEEF